LRPLRLFAAIIMALTGTIGRNRAGQLIQPALEGVYFNIAMGAKVSVAAPVLANTVLKISTAAIKIKITVETNALFLFMISPRTRFYIGIGLWGNSSDDLTRGNYCLGNTGSIGLWSNV
jgi:hypothetical protein